MASVFLSYAREDVAQAKTLARLLEKAGFTVWWDRHIQSGAEYAGAIEQALSEADVILVLWSKASVKSAWVRDEAEEGRDSGRLVPAILDGSRPPIGFRQIQTFDLGGWSGKGSPRQIDELVSALNAKAGAASAEPPKAARQASRFVAGITPKRTALVGLLVLALVAVGAWLYWSRSPLRAESPMVAVLPFADLSPQRDKAYFAEGVAEEILSTMATHGGIKVLGRTSARQIDKGADASDLRRRLGITHLLEGSARSAGEQLRVNVRLIDTSDGRQLWEEEYQGRPSDVFAVQDQIAGAVVQRLRGTLFKGQVRPAQPTDAQNYQIYLAARALTRTRTQKGLQEALTLAQKVVRTDPNYAPGQALVAELYYLLSNDFGAYGTIPIDQARALGIPYAQRAIRIAPDLADGHGALSLHMAPRGLRHLRRAIELDPSRAEFRVWLGFALNGVGRHDEALAQSRAAAEIDPLGLPPVTRYVHMLAAAGQPRQAENVVRQFVARGGDEALQHPMMVQVATWEADPSGVIAHGRKMLRNERVRHQYFRLFVAAALHTLGEGKRAASVLLPMQDLHAPYYQGDLERLRRNISVRGAGIWNSTDSGFAFLHLAKLREWNAIAELYDQHGLAFATFCDLHAQYAVPFVLALRSQGRSNESRRVLDCLRNRLAIEFRNKARDPVGWPGDLELRRASFSALTGDREGAFNWLGRAVGRGWLGQPYSSRLADYPQFDAVRGDPRLARLQGRIDARIAQERKEVG